MFQKMKQISMCFMMSKRYSELILLPTFEERFEYLRLGGSVGESTFGSHRELNQKLYRSEEWKRLRKKLMLRDSIGGYTCDLVFSDRPIFKYVYLHHITPITITDLINRRDCVFDPENLVCVSFETHQAIHYGDYSLIKQDYQPRCPNDTCLWR